VLHYLGIKFLIAHMLEFVLVVVPIGPKTMQLCERIRRALSRCDLPELMSGRAIVKYTFLFVTLTLHTSKSFDFVVRSFS
jgi:hypothetical protein